MAKPYTDMKMTLELSPKDRQLLRDVVDAIRSLKPEEPKDPGGPEKRLVEGTYPGADGRIRTVEGGAVAEAANEANKSFPEKRAEWLRKRGAG